MPSPFETPELLHILLSCFHLTLSWDAIICALLKHCTIWLILPSLVSIMKSICIVLRLHRWNSVTTGEAQSAVARGSFLVCVCVIIKTEDAACLRSQWNNSRLITLTIIMDSISLHLAGAEMIEFQTSDFKKGRSSCWVSMFVCLCAYVWRLSKPPIVYVCLCNKAQDCGSGQRYVCVWMWVLDVFSHQYFLSDAHIWGQSAQMRQVGYRRPLRC